MQKDKIFPIGTRKVSGKITTFSPIGWEACLFREMEELGGEWDVSSRMFTFKKTSAQKLDEALEYHSLPENLNGGQRNLRNKVHEMNANLNMKRVGDLIVIIDPYEENGTVKQLTADLKTLKVEVVKVINGVRLYCNYESQIPEALRALALKKGLGAPVSAKSKKETVSLSNGDEAALNVLLAENINKVKAMWGQKYVRIISKHGFSQITYNKKYNVSELLFRIRYIVHGEIVDNRSELA